MNHPPPLPLRLCPKHGLVSGRDGRCVICHRDDAGKNDERGNLQILGWALLFAVLFGGVFVFRTVRQVRASTPPVVRPETSVQAAAPTASEEQEPEPPNLAEARAARKVAEQAQRKRDIEREMTRVDVRMFVIPKCEMCDTARTTLKQQGIFVTELDVESDPSALERMRKLTSSTQVPVFEVDGEVLVGFGPTNVIGAVRRAAERRHPKP